MEIKRCETCPANTEYWKHRLSWRKGQSCPMELCRQPNQQSCSFCPIHMQIRQEYKDNIARSKRPKMVKCVEDDLVFASQIQAAEWYSANQASVSKVLDKELTLYGKHFVSWSCFKCAGGEKV